MSKSFHLGDLLSVTDGHLVSPDHIGGVYNVIDYVTGEQHMTHQLPRASAVVKPWLLEQHPWLADIKVPKGLNSKVAVMAWLAEMTPTVGEYHDVEPMPFGLYVGREPLAEARELAPQAIIFGGDTPPDN